MQHMAAHWISNDGTKDLPWATEIVMVKYQTEYGKYHIYLGFLEFTLLSLRHKLAVIKLAQSVVMDPVWFDCVCIDQNPRQILTEPGSIA